MSTTTEQAAAAIDAAREVLAGLASISRASREEVVDLLAQTAELARIVDAQRVRLAGEIAQRSTGPDEVSICAAMGKRSAREAVASAFGLRARDAAELLAMARATSPTIGLSGSDIAAPFPRIGAALDAGELSLAQARAIVSVLELAAPRADLEQLAWAERTLVEAATDREARLVPELLALQARQYAAVLDPDGVLPTAERQRDRRGLRIWQKADGMWRFEGDSPPESGSAIKAVLDAHAAPRAKVRFVDDAALDDEADADLDTRSLEQKRHDVLVALFEAHAASGGAPVAGGEAPRLVFTGTIEAFDAYARGAEHRDRALTIEHTGAIVPIEAVDRLLCDAVVQRAVVDADGHVLELGREQRLFTRAQHRALAIRYAGCATPGCGFPVAWTEAHHVLWWSEGGPTDTANGILLCNHCHHEVHAGRLVVVGAPGHWRVVPQLRPADRYARATRGAPVVVASAPTAAAPPLAVKLPDREPPSEPQREHASPPRFGARRALRARSPLESRLRHRLGARATAKGPAAADFHARHGVVMRT